MGKTNKFNNQQEKHVSFLDSDNDFMITKSNGDVVFKIDNCFYDKDNTIFKIGDDYISTHGKFAHKNGNSYVVFDTSTDIDDLSSNTQQYHANAFNEATIEDCEEVSSKPKRLGVSGWIISLLFIGLIFCLPLIAMTICGGFSI